MFDYMDIKRYTGFRYTNIYTFMHKVFFVYVLFYQQLGHVLKLF